MRRAGILAGVWAAGVVVAVALAFAAVAQVANGVAPSNVDRMSQRDIDDELIAPRTTTTSVRPSGRTTTSAPSSRTTTTTADGSKVTTSTTLGSAPPDTSTGLTVAPQTSPTTTTLPRPTTPTTRSTTPVSPPHNTVTASQGGTVYTRCSGPETIAYVAAVPKPGFERTVDLEGSHTVRQSFESSNHRSTIEAECSKGVVHAEVEEEAGDD